jgi:hypothetical protein
MRKVLFLIGFAVTTALGIAAQKAAPAPAINCPKGFAVSGHCGISFIGQGGAQPFAVVGTTSGALPVLSGSQVTLMPENTTHAALSLNYQKLVNAQAFTVRFKFVPNGWNIAFVLNNSTSNRWGFNGARFSQGAGCEAGFFQGFDQSGPPNNLFALELDSYSPLTISGTFSYSSAQIYTAGQSPCLPNLGGTNFTYMPISKISTSPVNLTTGAPNTTTGDTYLATLTYNGSRLTLTLTNLTHPRGTFTNTWNNVNIPAAVGGNTAWVGLTTATNEPVNAPLYVNSFVYTPGRVAPTPLPPTAATPTFSVTAGMYTSAQTDTISDATDGASFTISASETLTAIAVAPGYPNSAPATAAYTITPALPAPTFSVTGGTYAVARIVTVSDATFGTTNLLHHRPLDANDVIDCLHRPLAHCEQPDSSRP